MHLSVDENKRIFFHYNVSKSAMRLSWAVSEGQKHLVLEHHPNIWNAGVVWQNRKWVPFLHSQPCILDIVGS